MTDRTMSPRNTSPTALITDHYEIRGCRACPNALIGVAATAATVAHVVKASGWSEALDRRLGGRPARVHEKFRAAIAGCPNACSEPQIRDFGVLGQVEPGRGEAECTQCEACVAACREEAVEVDDEPSVNHDLCVNCGACVAACPTGALIEERRGYRVTAGGNLGRHPRLADTVFPLTDDFGVKAAARVALEIMMLEEGERLGDLLRREGSTRLRSWAVALREAWRAELPELGGASR